MIKFGVTHRGDYARYALDQERQHRGWWPYAYTLLADDSSSDPQFEEALVTRLYESLAAGDGVYKITRPGRFTTLDEQLANECQRRFPNTRPLVVHDMAASNAITSLELYRRLAKDRTVEFHASDYFDQLFLVSPPGSGWTVAFDAHGRPLQLSSERFVLSAYRKEPLRFLVNRLVQSYAWKSALPRAIEQFRRFQTQGQTEGVRAVRLFHTECLQEADRPGSTFHLHRHDAFATNPYRCDIVRIMNFLTGGHLPLEQIPAGIFAAGQGLIEGGLLILGRTVDEEDGRIRATIYQKRANRLHVEWDTQGGYEYHAQAESVRWDHPSQSNPAQAVAN